MKMHISASWLTDVKMTEKTTHQVSSLRLDSGKAKKRGLTSFNGVIECMSVCRLGR